MRRRPATGGAAGAGAFPPGRPAADGEGMRASHVATALAAFTAGLTAASALHRRAGRAVPAPVRTAVPTEAPAAPDAVVLPFPRPALAALPARRPAAPAAPAARPAAPAAPARCGDTGGVTKAGAPCAARATSGGRCHHHPLAA